MYTRMNLTGLIVRGVVAACAIAVQANGAAAANPPCNVPQTTNVVLTSNLVCDGTNGIVVGASGITIDLNGFQVSSNGTPGTAGVLNDGGYDNVKIINGRIFHFHGGIEIFNDSDKNTIQGIDVRLTTGDGILVFGGSDQLLVKDTSVLFAANIGINVGGATGVKLDRVESSQNVIGMHLASVIAAKLTNVVSSKASSGDGLLIDGTATGTTVSKSSFTANAGAGILLDGAGVTGTVIKDVIVSRNSFGGLRIEDADGTNVQKLTAAGNDAVGVQVNNHADSTHISQSLIVGNNGDGISISFDSSGAVLKKLTVTGNNLDGILSSGADALIASTIARANGGFGIFAAVGTDDGGGNKARGNSPTNCVEVQCGRP